MASKKKATKKLKKGNKLHSAKTLSKTSLSDFSHS
jgi:hypothetical protein